MPDSKNANLPLFYNDPAVLSAEAHNELQLLPERKFTFAALANSVPVVLGEVTKLLPHYPVIFTTGEAPVLVAVLGVRNNENLFVDAEGNWDKDTYIPAYVRRYPFILSQIPNGGFALGAEIDMNCFGETGEPLFKDKRPTKAARDAFRFCEEFQKAFDETRSFCKEVYDAGLLKSKACTIKLSSGSPLRLTGFATVDEAAIDDLDNRTANGWRRKHWLQHLYYHIASLENLPKYGARLEKKIVADPPA
jgi:hypothetical protein